MTAPKPLQTAPPSPAAALGGRGRCAACFHSDLTRINHDLVAKTHSLRSLGARYGITHKALAAHLRNHVTSTLVALPRPAGASTVLEHLQHLKASAERQLETAEQSGNAAQALAAVRECRETLKVIAAATGELKPTPAVIDVATLPAVADMRAKLIKALAPFPQARLACAAVLDTEGGQ